MDGLYKKVLRGQYSKIPMHYTDDLNRMLKKLLAVNSNQRPTCDQILQDDICLRWMKRLELMDNYNSQTSLYEEDDGLGGSLSLLKTIILPKNLKLLSDRLPKSKYGEDHSKSL